MTGPDDSEKERILAALRAYHGGTVYLMGSPDPVVLRTYCLRRSYSQEPSNARRVQTAKSKSHAVIIFAAS